MLKITFFCDENDKNNVFLRQGVKINVLDTHFQFEYINMHFEFGYQQAPQGQNQKEIKKKSDTHFQNTYQGHIRIFKMRITIYFFIFLFYPCDTLIENAYLDTLIENVYPKRYF